MSQENNPDHFIHIDKKRPSFIAALIPIAVLVTLLGLNVYFYEDNATYGPNQIALILAAAIACIIGLRLNFRWEEIQAGMVKSIKTALPAILILLIIGALTGTWMLSGIVPSMIYYGLDLMSPKFFLIAACLACSIVSVATGSSWTTVSTVGVALIGIADGLNIHPAIASGAIISGAYFGDKMSPLSDTTNLAPAMAGTDLFTHIRYMALTTIPTYIITLLIFLFIGLNIDSSANNQSVQALLQTLDQTYYISPLLFLVPVFIVVLIVKKVDAVPALLIGTLLGALVAVFVQPNIIKQISSYSGTATDWTTYIKQSYTSCINAMSVETSVVTDNEDINKLISTRGMFGMMNTVWLIVCAMCFGGVMEVTGMLHRISSSIVVFAKSAGSLIATTVSTCLFFNVTASDQYLAIVVPGRMYADTFRERGLKPENLSRTLEDSGTVTSVLVPWNTCGAYQSTMLNVATLDYLWYCYFNLLSPITTMIYGFFNIKIRKYSPAEIAEEKAAELYTDD